MEAYFAVCAGVSTLALLVGMVYLSAAAFELRKTALSVRKLADHVDERVEAFKSLGDVALHFSQSLQSGWLRGAELAYGLVSALRRSIEPNESSERPESERA